MSVDSIQEVMQSLKSVEHEQIRRDSEAYLEIVFSLEAMIKIRPVLEKFYGPAFKPAGMKAGREASEFSKGYGGIQKEQELYYKSGLGVSHLAMLWPWQDDKRVTLKIIEVH